MAASSSPPSAHNNTCLAMDPSQYYAYDQPRSRSLASTTDPSRYMQSTSQYQDVASYQSPQLHYGGQQTGHPRMDYQVSDGYASSYHQPTMTVAPSASYPGAMPQQQSSRPQTVMPASRIVSQPIPQHYNSYTGQLSSGYPPQSPGEQYARHHHSPQSAGMSYNTSPHMQHANYPNYSPHGSPHGSLHGSSTSHHRRPHPTPSPVSIPPASPNGIERYACERCDKTFSRAHDRKRHFETHHSPQPASHKCPYCRKDFSRADSLKRHCDNGCDKDPNRESP